MPELVVTERGPEVVEWKISGDLDFAGARLLRDALDACPGSPIRIVVDIADVPFIDSMGLAALIGLARRARERGTQVTVAHPRRSVGRVLQLTGVDKTLTVTDDAASVTAV